MIVGLGRAGVHRWQNSAGVDHALWSGLTVEVFSNLVHVTAEQHAAITRRSTYDRTRENITKVQSLSIPLCAGVIDFGSGQRVKQAQAELVNLGVPAVGYDRVGGLGRAAVTGRGSSGELCGRCGDGASLPSTRTATSIRRCSRTG